MSSGAGGGAIRLRQAVLAAHDLDGVCRTLREELGLGEPFSDEAVGWFGLRNAVFALGDQFLEVVSPVRGGTAAGRLLERLGEPACGYMLMFQVDDVAAARARAAQAGVREVFSVELDDMAEVHLHPRDMAGPIVSLSRPVPAQAWRWGGPDWSSRTVPGALAGVVVSTPASGRTGALWERVLGGFVEGVSLRDDPASDARLREVRLELEGWRGALELGGVRLAAAGR